jgi:hypothetical protein
MKSNIIGDISGNIIDTSGTIFANILNNTINDISLNQDIIVDNIKTNTIKSDVLLLSNSLGSIYIPSNMSATNINIDNTVNCTTSNINNMNITTLSSNNMNISNTLNATGTINLNNSVINLGTTGSTINIIGNTDTINTNDLNVQDKLITLNKNGTNAMGGGIEFEESNNVVGYIKVSSDKMNYLIKAPNNVESTLATTINTPIQTNNNIASTIISRDTNGNFRCWKNNSKFKWKYNKFK